MPQIWPRAKSTDNKNRRVTMFFSSGPHRLWVRLVAGDDGNVTHEVAQDFRKKVWQRGCHYYHNGGLF